jgi:hypothetical protein
MTARRTPLFGALAASVVLLVVRLYAAERLGFGDAEALYACYARHPQPVYLDHPGLVGVFARMIGGGDAPSPIAAHVVTAFLATATPWLAALAARLAGASLQRAATAAVPLMLAPEISIGLFGMTPDLLLIVFWYATVGATIWAITAAPGSTRALVGALGSGVAVGLAFDAKVSGGLLLAGLVLAWSSPHARAHRRTLAPWSGLALALLLVSPVMLDEVARGFPMLRHRLIDTQRDAGLSLRNVGALLGGQLLYVTPPLLMGAFFVARDLYRRRNEDIVSWTLWSVSVTALPLVLLALLSRVAEPHWVAPIYLALPIAFALRSDLSPREASTAAEEPVDTGDRRKGIRAEPRQARPLISQRIVRSSIATGAIVIAFAHAWVLTSLAPRLLGSSYNARYDLANDLYAWDTALPVLRNAIEAATESQLPPPIVIGPHWTVCAQAHAMLPRSVLVGCHAQTGDDFRRWLPPSVWEHAPVLLYVTDDRFELPADALRDRREEGVWSVDVHRGGTVVRRISIRRLIALGVARNE